MRLRFLAHSRLFVALPFGPAVDKRMRWRLFRETRSDLVPKYFVAVSLGAVLGIILKHDQMVYVGAVGRNPILAEKCLVLLPMGIARHSHAEGCAEIFGEFISRAIIRQPVTEIFRAEERRSQRSSLYANRFLSCST